MLETYCSSLQQLKIKRSSKTDVIDIFKEQWLAILTNPSDPSQSYIHQNTGQRQLAPEYETLFMGWFLNFSEKKSMVFSSGFPVISWEINPLSCILCYSLTFLTSLLPWRSILSTSYNTLHSFLLPLIVFLPLIISPVFSLRFPIL